MLIKHPTLQKFITIRRHSTASWVISKILWIASIRNG